MMSETVDHLRFLGLGSAGFCHLDRIRTAHREGRREHIWQKPHPVLVICYEGDEAEYEFHYNNDEERDEAYMRLTKAVPFLRLSSSETEG